MNDRGSSTLEQNTFRSEDGWGSSVYFEYCRMAASIMGKPLITFKEELEKLCDRASPQVISPQKIVLDIVQDQGLWPKPYGKIIEGEVVEALEDLTVQVTDDQRQLVVPKGTKGTCQPHDSTPQYYVVIWENDERFVARPEQIKILSPGKRFGSR